jgi:hypothetical protein
MQFLNIHQVHLSQLKIAHMKKEEIFGSHKQKLALVLGSKGY